MGTRTFNDIESANLLMSGGLAMDGSDEHVKKQKDPNLFLSKQKMHEAATAKAVHS